MDEIDVTAGTPAGSVVVVRAGIFTCHAVRHHPQPSTVAASVSSPGTDRSAE